MYLGRRLKINIALNPFKKRQNFTFPPDGVVPTVEAGRYEPPVDKNHSLNYSDNKNKEELNLKAMRSFLENAPTS